MISNKEVTLISSSNGNFKKLEGIIGKLSYGMNLEFDFNNDLNGDFVPPFDLRKGFFTSSLITNISIVEKSRNYFLITISTKNSEYIFGNGIESDLKPYTDKEVLDLQLATGMYLF